jgi:hypothetical protein
MLVIGIILCVVSTIVSISSNMFTVINLANIVFTLIALHMTIILKYSNNNTHDNDMNS